MLGMDENGGWMKKSGWMEEHHNSSTVTRAKRMKSFSQAFKFGSRHTIHKIMGYYSPKYPSEGPLLTHARVKLRCGNERVR